MRKKIAVYSCITDNYEPFRHKQNKSDADFFMFSNTWEWSDTWKYLRSKDLFADPRRNARYHKALPHEYFGDYDFTCWIDGSMEVVASIKWLIDRWVVGYDIVAFEHPDRDRVFEEAQILKTKGYDYPDLIDKQMDKYKKEDFLHKEGLSETKIVIRRNTAKITEFNKLWFYEMATGSLRDQLSFDYCVWKTGLRLNRVPPMQKGQEAFKYYKHAKKREETKYT